jgi:hypothetical protein
VGECAECRRRLEAEFRYCPDCGSPQRIKIVEYFRGDRELDEGDLRVSAYITTPRHVRLSVWSGDRADAVVSLDPRETRRLARFLVALAPTTQRHRATGLTRRLRALIASPREF